MANSQKQRYFFFDLETTGLVPGYHEIIEMGILCTDGAFNKVSERVIRMHPQHLERASDIALEVNGYKDRLPEWGDAANSPQEFVEDLMRFKETWVHSRKLMYLVAHNAANFDLPFLTHLFKDAKTSWRKFAPRYVYDTVSMAHQMGYKKLSGDYLLKKLGLPPEPDVHHALNGAEKVKNLYIGLSQQVGKQEVLFD